MSFEPMEGIEPTTPRLQITCSGQLSYIGNIVLFPFQKSFRELVFVTGLQRYALFLILQNFSIFFEIFFIQASQDLVYSFCTEATFFP